MVVTKNVVIIALDWYMQQCIIRISTIKNLKIIIHGVTGLQMINLN